MSMPPHTAALVPGPVDAYKLASGLAAVPTAVLQNKLNHVVQSASGIKVSSGGVDVDLVRDLLKPLGDSAQCAGQEPTFLRRQIGAALNYLSFFAALLSERPRVHTQACTRTSRTMA